ncbi:MAG: DegV family protein [Coriobacteriia bacterium]|nr:DegV family protein [Coriobacteriia bacterium]
MTRADFVLVTDSCCDLTREVADAMQIAVLEFPFTLDGEQYFDDLGASMPHAQFYARMREGSAPTTAQVPMSAYLEAYRSAAESGTPLLLLSFSSGLSGTYDAAVIARDAVLAEFTDADIRVVDTLAASAQQGLLVLEAARRREAGAGIDELEAWVLGNTQCLNVYFTIESLEALRRGGRVADWAAAAGTMLDVKPILRVNGRGELVVDRTVRGRKKSLRALAEIFAKRAVDTAARTVVIAHADAEGDAAALEVLLRGSCEIGEVLTFDLGPVIGSHTGPGMVAAVFWGPERES